MREPENTDIEMGSFNASFFNIQDLIVSFMSAIFSIEEELDQLDHSAEKNLIFLFVTHEQPQLMRKHL